MRLFWELARLSFQRQFTYRAASMAGLATNFFFGALRAAVMVALFGSRQNVEGVSLQGAITYTGVSQASIAFLSLFAWFEVVRSVYNGDIGSDLLKPMNYFVFWMAQDLGRAIANLILRGLPIMAFYALVFDITTPQTAGQWLLLTIILVLAWILSFSWRFLANLSAFWVPNAIAISRFAFTVAWFTSGFLMPLRFLPEWFQRLCYLTPFPHSVNTIIEAYLGLLQGSQAVMAVLGQVTWILVLIVANAVVLRAGVRRLVILGG